MSVLCVGETMAAWRAEGPLRLGCAGRLSIAGSESNVAIGLARLGIAAHWVGVVGADELGVLVTRTLRAEGVVINSVRTDPSRPTGLLVFEPVIGHRTRAAYYRRGSAGSTLGPTDVKQALDEFEGVEADGLGGQAGSPLSMAQRTVTPPDGRAMHPAPPGATGDAPRLRAVVTSGITLALGASAATAARYALLEARKRGAVACLAVNFRAALWSRAAAAKVLADAMADTDIVIASGDELALAAGRASPSALTEADQAELAAELLGRGVSEVVVTSGQRGARVWSSRGSWQRAAHAVEVVDTIGAGDAFTAGYLSARLASLPCEQALELAVRTGAFCVGSRGDWEGLPTLTDLDLLAVEPGEALR